MKKRKIVDIYGLAQSLPLIYPLRQRNNTGQDLPLNSLDRCHERWENLFFGIWRALYEYEPLLIHKVLESMRNHGLIDDDCLSVDLFSVNPPDDVLRQARTFREGAATHKLTSRKPPWKRQSDPLDALIDYSSALSIIRVCP